MFTIKIGSTNKKSKKNSKNNMSEEQMALINNLFFDVGPYYLRKCYETNVDVEYNSNPAHKNRKKSFAFTIARYTGLGQLQQLSMSGVKIHTEHFHVSFDPSGMIINKIFSGPREETFETWNEWEGTVDGISTVWGNQNGALKEDSAFTAAPRAKSFRE